MFSLSLGVGGAARAAEEFDWVTDREAAGRSTKSAGSQTKRKDSISDREAEPAQFQRPVAPQLDAATAPALPATAQRANAQLFGAWGVSPSNVNVRAPVAASMNSIPGAEGTVRATTDVGDLMGSSPEALGLGVQRRNPIVTDPRVRGSRVGSLAASGSYWIPARIDLDTVVSKLDSRNIERTTIVPGPYSVLYGPGFQFIDVELLQATLFPDGFEAHGESIVDFKTNGQQWNGRQNVWAGNQNWGFRGTAGIRVGNDYTTGDGRRIPSSYKSRDESIALAGALSEASRVDANYLRLDQTDVELPGQAFNIKFLYTDAYTSFGVKCAVAPAIPNNAGSLAAITVTAPENTIVNAPHPCAVVARATIGHMLPDVVFGCLNQALPERVPAEGTSNLWNIRLAAGHGTTGKVGDNFTSFAVTSFHSGGAGARPHQDGLSATPFPSGVRNVPVEITEAITPMVFWRKDLRLDSGGPGRQRGGLGQTVVLANREGVAYGIHAVFERIVHPPRGRDGGAAGASGRVSVGSGTALKAKGFQVIPAGERLVIEMPGGGGFGEPQTRDAALVANDVAMGLVSVEAARRDYKVVVSPDGALDQAATTALRRGG